MVEGHFTWFHEENRELPSHICTLQVDWSAYQWKGLKHFYRLIGKTSQLRGKLNPCLISNQIYKPDDQKTNTNFKRHYGRKPLTVLRNTFNSKTPLLSDLGFLLFKKTDEKRKTLYNLTNDRFVKIKDNFVMAQIKRSPLSHREKDGADSNKNLVQ